MATKQYYENAYASLERIQEFDVTTLGREDDLGKRMNFGAIIDAADEIVTLYRRLSLDTLSDLIDPQLQTIQTQADSDYQLFTSILEFNPDVNDAANTRNSYINSVDKRRDQLFNQIWQFIAFSVARKTDTSLLEAQARATIQTIEDRSNKLTSDLEHAKTSADEALATIRKVASEQGVTCPDSSDHELLEKDGFVVIA